MGTGTHVPCHVVEELHSGDVLVQNLLQIMEVTIAMVQRWKENNVTRTFALSMVVSPSGQVLVNVRYRVVVEQRHEKENAQTLDLSIMESHAQVQPQTQSHVVPDPVQLMVATLHLESGINVASHVVVELKSEHELVRTHVHNTVVNPALYLVLL